MGYASLTYVTNGTVPATTVLHDIVGCVTGQFSSSVQLRGATSASSEIVNTLGQNWSIAYPTSSYNPSIATSSLASWVLTAPCINPSKTKYVRLTNYYKFDASSPPVLSASGSGVNNLYSTSSAPCGVLLQGITSASSATTVNNQTFYNTNNGGVPSNIVTHPMITGNTIIVSWSSRHLVIWSNGVSSTTNNILLGYIEYPETDVTVGQNITPAAFLIERNGNLNSNITGYGPINISTANTIIQGDIQFPGFYNPTAAINASASFTGLASNTDILMSTVGSVAKSLSTIPTINSSGTNQLMLMPIIVNILSIGVPNIYLSTYSNMYTVANGLGNAGDTISVGNNTYAYLPSNTGMSFAIKKE